MLFSGFSYASIKILALTEKRCYNMYENKNAVGLQVQAISQVLYHLHNGRKAILHGILYIILPFIHGTRNELCILFSGSV